MISIFRTRNTVDEVRANQPEDDRYALFSPQDIPAKDGSGDVYLHRYRIIKTPWFGIYVHDLNLPDTDRDPHDHPWVFWSFILRGGYEERLTPLCEGRIRYADHRGSYRRWRARWSWHRTDTDVAHIIETVLPKTKTLVFTGRRRKGWGFWTPEGYVDWQAYVRRYYGELAA